MSIATQLEGLASDLSNIKTAITDRGGTVSDEDGFYQLPQAIRTISGVAHIKLTVSNSSNHNYYIHYTYNGVADMAIIEPDPNPETPTVVNMDSNTLFVVMGFGMPDSYYEVNFIEYLGYKDEESVTTLSYLFASGIEDGFIQLTF